MAARLRRDLNAAVDMVSARYGEFKVLVDDQVVVDGGSAAFLGLLPSYERILNEVRQRLPMAVS